MLLAMSRKLNWSFGIIVVILCLSSLNGCVVSTPTPTPFPTSTETKPPTETPYSTVTPSPTASPSQTVTHTKVPTSFSVQCRDEFKEMVIAGQVKCQGSTGGFRASTRFAEELNDSELITLGKYTLISGIPSTDNPMQCIYVMTFIEGGSYIIYKDSSNATYVWVEILAHECY